MTPVATTATTHRLAATQPFSWERSIGFLQRFTPLDGEQRIDGEGLRKAFALPSGAAVCDVVGAGTGIDVTVHTADTSDRLVEEALERVSSMFCLDQDLGPFYSLAAGDPVIAPIVERAHGFHHVEFPTPFECVAWAVLNQRVGQRAAKGYKRRLIDRAGPALVVDGDPYAAFPTATDLLPHLDGLAEDVPNAQRHRALRSVVEAFAAVDEAWLRSAALDEVAAWLEEIRGVGPWTRMFVLFRGLSRFERVDLLPLLSQEIQRAYGVADEAVQSIADRYGTAQGFWLLYLRTGRTYAIHD